MSIAPPNGARRRDYDNRKMDSIDCRNVHPDQSCVGPLGKHELALVHCFRWSKFVPVVTDALVLNGGYPGQVGCREK